MAEQRLLSVHEAAVYLGLGSRYAIYRLISGGQLPAVRLGRRIRLDLRDLDAMIENAKTVSPLLSPEAGRGIALRAVPTQLAPLQRRNRQRSQEHTPVTRRPQIPPASPTAERGR